MKIKMYLVDAAFEILLVGLLSLMISEKVNGQLNGKIFQRYFT